MASSEWVVFLGPSLERTAAKELVGATFVDPIRRGDLERHLARGARHFAIIDGEFGQNLSVSLREIRQALSLGASVWGAASMGALRAAEAWPLGMQGVGWIYEAYRSGAILSDDEVALLFDPRSLRALSVPLVNVRWVLERGLQARRLTDGEAQAILGAARDMHFAERTYGALVERLSPAQRMAFAPLASAVAADPHPYDRKRQDAVLLLERLAAGIATPRVSTPTILHGTFTRTAPPALAALMGEPAATAKVPGSHRQRQCDELLVDARRDAERLGVSRLAEVGRLDVLGVHVYNTIRPGAHEFDNTVTGGKGLSAPAAQAAALLEAVERACMSAEQRRPWFGTWKALCAERRALHPAELTLASDSTWTVDQPLHWWPMRELFTGDEIWVPASRVFFPFTSDPYLWRQSTTGLAAGSGLTEALVYALLENIERDALGISRELSRARPVLLESVQQPELLELLRALAAHGVRAHAWLLHSEVALPAFEVVLEDTQRLDPMYLNGGHGCHLDPANALGAALLEAIFARVSVIAGAREDLAEQARRFGDRSYAELRQQALGWQNPEGRSIDLATLPDLSTPSSSGDLEVLLRALSEAGYERVLACDLSSDECTFSVVRCVVPEMIGTQTVNRAHPRLARSAASEALPLTQLSREAPVSSRPRPKLEASNEPREKTKNRSQKQ